MRAASDGPGTPGLQMTDRGRQDLRVAAWQVQKVLRILHCCCRPTNELQLVPRIVLCFLQAVHAFR